MSERSKGWHRFGFPLAAAIRFLTILPWPAPPGRETDYFRQALYFFPLVGLGIGLFLRLAATLIGLALPAGVAAALLAVLLSWVSGFLHLDGLADTADGFMSAADPTRILEIMRDSRIGVMGAAAIAAALLLKYAALQELLASGQAWTVVVVPLWSRTSMVVLMAVLPYARREGGLGALFYSRSTRRAAFFSMAISGAVMAIISVKGLVVASIAAGCMVWWFAGNCRKKIGGATGDTLGAIGEITETAVLLALTIVI